MSDTIKRLATLSHDRITSLLELYINQAIYPAKNLQHAMFYTVSKGGKRLRPLIIYCVGDIFNAPAEKLDAAACAVELIHAYSLVHDDLPAMDNSDVRRGNPSCHKAFDEATAILAGDALQTLAFEVLASHPSTLSTQARLKMITVLSKASGVNGMAGGQALDLSGIDNIENLNEMYRLKTGALFNACIQLACLASDVDDVSIINALQTYINNIGLAFQIQDDLLDVLGDPFQTGKPVGTDIHNSKITYPTLFGLEQTKQIIDKLFAEALSSLAPLHKKTSLLELATLIMNRKA